MLKSKKQPLQTYSGGVVRIFREKDKGTSFGASLNAVTIDDLMPIVKLWYEEQSVREQDFTFAERRGFSVSSKIRTPLVLSVESDCKAVIGKLIYDIAYIDRTKTEMFLYLEGGTPFGYDS